MDFKPFSHAVHAQYEKLAKGGELYIVQVENIFDTYLAAWPEGTNPIFRQRTVYDCNCCKQFIRKLGVLVAIDTAGKVHTVWDDLDLPEPFNEVAQRLAEVVRQAPIRTVFRSKERKYGVEYNYDTQTNDRWDHFHGTVGAKHYTTKPEEKRGEIETTAAVMKRGLTEISKADLDTVVELIDSNNLYRGNEVRHAVVGFRDLLRKWDGSETYIWANVGNQYARFRSTSIGTLLTDLAAGTALEDAVRKYEAMVAPQNYKRTTALITQRMIDDAVKTLQDLDLEGAVNRRFARLGDVSVNNVLFVDNGVRGKMKGGVAGILEGAARPSAPPADKATAISAKDFIKDVLPKATRLEVYVENKHAGNFVSLTGGDGPERLFKWDNNFAWSYDGEVTDSIKARVKKAGGNIHALMRVSLGWFNYDDLDLHCITPNRAHISYMNKAGILDVDMNAAGRKDSRQPVENLAFQSIHDGVYKVHVNNYMTCEQVDKGFSIEVEFAGVVQQFSYSKAIRGSSSVDALEIVVKNQKVVEVRPGEGLIGGSVSQEKWGVKTETLVPVSIVCHSPNHWDENRAGAEHLFFMLKGCKNPDPVRGIYNEFLRPEFEKHRKVFEVLGSKTKCPPTEDQISGVGFTSARGDSVTVVVDGRRSYNINF